MRLARPTSTTTAASLLVGLLGGLVGAASLPPFGFWPVAPLGIAMLLLALEDHGWLRRAATGWLFGLGLLVPGLWWASHFNWYGAAALMLIESAFFAVAALAIAPGRGRTLTAIGALTLAEALRASWPLGGLPIGGLPLGQVGGPLLNLARVIGPLGIMASLVVLGAGVRILTTALAARSDGGEGAALRVVHGAVLLGLVAVAVLGAALSPAGGPSLGRRSVAAVQGGGRRGTSAEQTDPATVTAAHLAAATKVPTSTALTVLPEDVVGLDGPLKGSWQLAGLRATAIRLGTTLLAGVTTPVGTTRFDNFVVALDASGTVIGSVEKVHRVPFGEYIPDRALVRHLADIAAVPRDAVPGTGHEVLATPAGRLGVLISFEVFFSSRGADVVRHGAQLLVVPTNTTSYPTTQMPSQELAAARLQAVERGRYLVQASPTGFSAIIAPSGKVLAQSALSRREVVTGSVELLGGQTTYTRLGDAPVLLAALLVLVAGQVRSIRWPGRADGADLDDDAAIDGDLDEGGPDGEERSTDEVGAQSS
jgi:apolipoprotein N-acyltransferase